MHLYPRQAAKAGITVPMQFLTLGEAAFHGFLATFINRFALICITMAVYFLFVLLPDMPRHDFHARRAAGTLPQKGTRTAEFRFGNVFTIAFTRCRAIPQDLVLRAKAAI